MQFFPQMGFYLNCYAITPFNVHYILYIYSGRCIVVEQSECTGQGALLSITLFN